MGVEMSGCRVVRVSSCPGVELSGVELSGVELSRCRVVRGVKLSGCRVVRCRVVLEPAVAEGKLVLAREIHPLAQVVLPRGGGVETVAMDKRSLVLLGFTCSLLTLECSPRFARWAWRGT